MVFLVWDNPMSASRSLVAVNALYGCPYRAENGYRMDRWDFPARSYSPSGYGFFKPEERLGMKRDDFMRGLMSGFTEYDEKPAEFYPEGFEEV